MNNKLTSTEIAILIKLTIDRVEYLGRYNRNPDQIAEMSTIVTKLTQQLFEPTTPDVKPVS